MQNYAHVESIAGNAVCQTVREHCLSVAKIMGKHCKGMGMYHIGYLIGLMHDMGKCTKEFQSYLLSNDKDKKGKIDHSTAAARYLCEHMSQDQGYERNTVEIIAMVIMSHHSMLQNFCGPDNTSDFVRRVVEKELPNYEESVANYFDPTDGVATPEEIQKLFTKAADECKILRSNWKEINCSVKGPATERKYYVGMCMKVLHGCMIDADWLDSANWLAGDIKVYSRRPSWSAMHRNLMKKYQAFGEPRNAVEQGRADIAEQCAAFAEKPPGIYRLSVPTGAGKTLSVLRFALPHAQKHKMRHIIEVIPYTSIVEQNAKDVREAVQSKGGRDYVYEHHCNMDMALDKNGDFTDVSLKRRAVTERWDAPIIFTTQVRLLSMLFGGKKGDFRRLNALHDSILIFDEIQTLPIRCIYMFNLAMNFLCRTCHCTIILSTATQPQLETLEYPILDGGEMITHLDSVFDTFRRVHIHYDSAVKSAKQIGQELFFKARDDKNALCIVNTTSAAREIAKEVAASKAGNYDHEVKIIYLSTKLCPKHRMDVIKKMKEDLAAGKKIVCVSTQLIEAGVNISFANVYRSEASLASVAQAAGRCNRNGEAEYGNVYIFNPGDLEKLTKLQDIAEDKMVLKELLNGYRRSNGDDFDAILNPEYIEDFFNRHYHRGDGLARLSYPEKDKGWNLLELLSKNKTLGGSKQTLDAQAFRTAAEDFEVISNDTVPVLVPYGSRGEALISVAMVLDPERCSTKDYVKFMKEAQFYCVNLWPYEQDDLLKTGQMTATASGIYALTSKMNYDPVYGIVPASSMVCIV